MYSKISNFKFQISNSERGVSLIIAFFIMVIILAVVLSLSALLYSEIKVIRNIGNSVVAFYAADSGVEKVLYYDRKILPEGGTRGICNICGFLETCTNEGTDCNPATCTDCEVTFSTNLPDSADKTYNVTATVSPNGDSINLNIKSKGSFNNVVRQIEINSQ